MRLPLLSNNPDAEGNIVVTVDRNNNIYLAGGCWQIMISGKKIDLDGNDIWEVFIEVYGDTDTFCGLYIGQ